MNWQGRPKRAYRAYKREKEGGHRGGHEVGGAPSREKGRDLTECLTLQNCEHGAASTDHPRSTRPGSEKGVDTSFR